MSTYLSQDHLERQLPFTHEAFGIDDTNTDADGNTEWDNLLQTVLEREADRLESWANTAWEVRTHSDTLDGTGRDELPLPEKPIDSVTSVTVDGTTLATDDYHVYDTHLALSEDAALNVWPDERQTIEVEYSSGYDSVPGPVEDALIRLCRNALDQIESDGVSQESEGGFSYTFRPPSEVKREVLADISAHKAPSYYGGAGVV